MDSVPVLLVEDNPSIRERLIALIAAIPGLSLAGAEDSAEGARAAIARTRPGLVILDLQLRADTGWDVLTSLDPDAGSPRVIVLTNHSEPEFRTRALRAGASGFYDKSTEFESFAAALRAM